MLKYLAESTETNAMNAGMMNVHRMMEDIKRNRKIGVKFMQSWEEKEYYFDQGKAEGKAEGIREGRIEGKIDSILELLAELGDIPEEIRERISSEKDMDKLREWIKLATKVDAVEEFIAAM